MPDLTNLTHEECLFLVELLEREEGLGRLPARNAAKHGASVDENRRLDVLRHLLRRLKHVCSTPSKFHEDSKKVLAAEKLGGYG